MLEVRKIHKHFRGVHALKDVSIVFNSGEIHGLLGENGAGKSTLMKIVSGVYFRDRGEILLDGDPVAITNPQDAYNLGIRIVHQELSLISSLSIAENMYIHKFRDHKIFKFVDRKGYEKDARDWLVEWGVDIDTSLMVSEISMGVRQLVEIARELSTGGKVIILDEPTSSLTFPEIEQLFKVCQQLKSEGYVLIFISHRMDEVMTLVDRVTVLRDGEMVSSGLKEEHTAHEIIELIAGKEMDEIGGLFPKTESSIDGVALSVENLSGKGFENISLDVHWGEILGIAGLVGAGRSELIRTIYGMQSKTAGRIIIGGEEVDITSPITAIDRSIVMLSESRGVEGIFPEMTVSSNFILLKVFTIVKNKFLSKKKIKSKTDSLVNKLNVSTHNAFLQTISELSGGNQQKVVVGRLLGAEPKILLLDEPTRGVDVGSKTEIHKIIGNFVKEGGAVIMVSSELDEQIGVSDRILVLNEGSHVGTYDREKFNKAEILKCMMQIKETA